MAASLLAIVVLALPILGGLLLLSLARRRRRSHPSCGRCGYDVSGSVGVVARCPECGAPFAEGGIVPPFRDGQQRLLVAGGLLTIILGLACAGSAFAHALAVRSEMAARATAARAQAALATAPAEPDSP